MVLRGYAKTLGHVVCCRKDLSDQYGVVIIGSGGAVMCEFKLMRLRVVPWIQQMWRNFNE